METTAGHGPTPDLDAAAAKLATLGGTTHLARIPAPVPPPPSLGVLRDADGRPSGYLLRPGDLAVVAGPPGSGKSTWAASLTVEVASRGRGVVWWDLEGTGVDELLEGVGCDQAAARNILVLSDWPERLPSQPRAVERIAGALEGQGISLLVVDSVGELAARAGVDVVQDGAVAALFGPLRALSRRSGAAVVLLDHTRKCGDGGTGQAGSAVTGSVRKVAATDLAVVLEPATTSVGVTSAPVTVAKSRRHPPATGRLGYLEIRTDGAGRRQVRLVADATAIPPPDPRAVALLEALATHGPMSWRRAMRTIGGDSSSNRALLRELVARGSVVVDPPEHRGRPARVRLSDQQADDEPF